MAYKDNHKFYKSAISKYGISAQGVHWNSTYTQYKRFEVLTSFIEEKVIQSNIIDAGCGFGEYYNYLFDNQLKPKSYLGIDCEEKMINLASKRFLEAKFEISNILEDKLSFSDYYICSGALNILEKEEVFVFIEKCFEASKVGFIFNFLKNDSLTKIEHIEVIAFCKKISKKVQIKDNYLDNDISIFIKK
jgi:2-polyprenyl-3-methyl-5-hydroxy-6-metoxy-1,4-benzoquinol methylase